MDYERVVALRRNGLTLRQIGGEVGISGERVRQILQRRYGATNQSEFVVRSKLSRLVGCSDYVLCILERTGAIHPVCKGRYYFYHSSDVSEIARIVHEWAERHRPVVLVCGQCGKSFRLSYSEYNARLRNRRIACFFCCRSCFGKYISKLRGFGFRDSRRR